MADRPCHSLLRTFDLHKLPAESAFDAEVAASDVVVERRRHADDFAVLFVHGEITAHAAVGTNSVSLLLPRFVPGAGLAHLVFALEHQRAGRADADAVAAIDARGVRQGDVELGGDVGGDQRRRRAFAQPTAPSN